jgi:hypothetical protein
LKGLGKERSVLIQDVELDKIYGTPIHVDLLAVKADEEVEVGVPLVFTGVAPAEKDLGGSLVKVMYEIEISALPKNLPHEISVDLSGLKTFEDQVKVGDIILPTGVTAITGAGEVVALVQPPRGGEEGQDRGGGSRGEITSHTLITQAARTSRAVFVRSLMVEVEPLPLRMGFLDEVGRTSFMR